MTEDQETFNKLPADVRRVLCEPLRRDYPNAEPTACYVSADEDEPGAARAVLVSESSFGSYQYGYRFWSSRG